MDFDLSKENIQPLRGGRNVQQLGMALQAQTNSELQMQLKQQEEEFVKAIRTYNGDDPLENWYQYISWIEQSYPKHGHEGNLSSLLEDCLATFENESLYINDRRFCKLWIKYIDLQLKPLELYHMMKSKGLCKGCADFYKAWAYYYEAAGDFQAANNIFEEGKQQLAQPYDELDVAHKNLIIAAGQHTIFGPDQNRLMQKRQALTSLQTYKSGRVSNVRVPSHSGPVTVPNLEGGPSGHRSNAMMFVYEDKGMDVVSVEEAGPASIIAAARLQEAPKENQMKPGPWTTMPITKKRLAATHTGPAFTILEETDITDGIRLPLNYPKTCQEDYSDWHVSVKYPEPPNPSCIPMYPKEQVYFDPNTEYSIEELRARRYLSMARNRHIPIMEQDILEDVEYMQESLDELKNDIFQRSLHNHMQAKETVNRGIQPEPQPLQYVHEVKPESPSFTTLSPPFNVSQRVIPNQNNPPRSFVRNDDSEDRLVNVIWNDDSISASNPEMMPAQKIHFAVFEQSLQDVQPHIPPKAGSAMKTALKDLNADELAETGSRGGMDVAATAQAADCASQNRQINMDASCNTYMFNFNLNAAKSSTPQNKKQIANTVSSDEEMGITRKDLFTEPNAAEKDKALSTIFEETKSSYGSSGSSGATTKSSLFTNASNKMGAISEEHNSYLEQNMSVNAALRISLLGQIMNLNSTPPPVPVPNDTLAHFSPMQSSPMDSPIRHIPNPSVVTPLDYVPSDPFKANLINQLLQRVSFPGPHTEGYIEVDLVPRLTVKKEPVLIGNERYIIEKQLGKGTFGIVYKAFDVNSGSFVAIKYQKPANKWEYHICRELQSRLAAHPLRDRFMEVSIGYFNDQASILVSEFMPGGSLLDLANSLKQKSGRTMKECLVIYFCIEMLKMIQAMHEVKIIHADIKPDNFLVFVTPDNTVGLQLIDFGCSIDMSLFPPNASFTKRVTTEDFVCCEMLDGRPWNYHTDLFCVAATAHVLLFDSYIKIKKQDDMWSITQRFSRYVKVDLWNMFFSSLLNQQNGPADTATLQFLLQEKLDILNKDASSALPFHMRAAVNLLRNR